MVVKRIETSAGSENADFIGFIGYSEDESCPRLTVMCRAWWQIIHIFNWWWCFYSFVYRASWWLCVYLLCFIVLFWVFFPGNESETSVIIVWATAAYEWTYSPCVCVVLNKYADDTVTCKTITAVVTRPACLPGLLFLCCCTEACPPDWFGWAGRRAAKRGENTRGPRRESRGRFLTLLILLEEAG